MDATERDHAFAELLSSVVEHHTVASRLAGTVQLAEDTLAQALRIGDAVRRARRDGAPGRPDEHDCQLLSDLVDRLDRATDDVLRTELARSLRDAISACDATRSAVLALELFAGLVRPAPTPPFLFAGLSARRRTRDGETLLHPGALAAQIAGQERAGLMPSSSAEVTPGDEPVLPEPIAFVASFAACAADLALRRPTAELATGVVEDTASADLLVFSARVAGPFTVLCATESDDEWWAAGTTSFAAYCAELTRALDQLGIRTERVS
jgi:hypothetical protein